MSPASALTSRTFGRVSFVVNLQPEHPMANTLLKLALGGAALYGLLRVSRAIGHPYKVVDAGAASWSGPGYNGRQTANQEIFDENLLTAAHKTLPFNTVVDVVDMDTGRSVRVRINDRGPYVPGRVIDLSRAAARQLGIEGKGVAKSVEVRIPT